MNPRRRRYARMRRRPRVLAERALGREACLFGSVNRREEYPFTGTFAAWCALPFPKRIGIIYHPGLVKQLNRRTVLLDLLKPFVGKPNTEATKAEITAGVRELLFR
jgi:hypothetical protein